MVEINETFAVDYERILTSYGLRKTTDTIEQLRNDLPPLWVGAYSAMCNGPTNIYIVNVDGYEYLFDLSSELLKSGRLTADQDREDRIVVTYGLSSRPQRSRDATRIKGYPGKSGGYDKGHLAGHAMGGGLDINLIHQESALNRGWSDEGKLYRKMEKYCAKHIGTFFFSRPIYEDASACPTQLEYGVLLHDGTLWAEVFINKNAS